MKPRGARFPMWSPPYSTHAYPDDKRRYPLSDNLNVSPPSPTSSFQRALATIQVNSSLSTSENSRVFFMIFQTHDRFGPQGPSILFHDRYID